MKNTDLSIISKLSMIKMSEDEMKALENDAQRITEMADALAKYENSDKSCNSHIQACELREDDPKDFKDSKLLISCTSMSQNGYVLVPGSIKEAQDEQ